MTIRGAYWDIADRGVLSAAFILSMMKKRPSLACWIAPAMVSMLIPLIFMSICIAVTPTRVPATLKSMSPRASSTPWISLRTATCPSPVIRPIAIPATCPLIGTPASIIARLEPHTLAIEVEPLDERISVTSRIV